MTTLEFLQFLTRYAQPEQYVMFATLSPQPDRQWRNEAFKVSDIPKAMRQCLVQSHDNLDVYVRLTVLAEPPGRGHRGKEIDSVGGCVAWVDVDRPFDEVMAGIAANPALPRPSVSVRSGHGAHLYWAFDRFVDDIADIVAINRWLESQIDDADHCYDAARVLRVPGTTNWKDPDNPQPVEVAEQTDTVLVVDTIVYMARAYAASVQRPTLADSQFEELTAKEVSLEYLLGKGISQDVLDRVETGAGAAPSESTGQPDRSRADYANCLALFRGGCTPAEVLYVLTHDTWFSGSKFRDNGYRYTYAITTLERTWAIYLDERGTIRPTTSRILEPILAVVCFFVDKNNTVRPKPWQGDDLAQQAAPYLLEQGVRFLVDKDNPNSGFIGTLEGDIIPADYEDKSYARWVQRISGWAPTEQANKHLRSALVSYVLELGEPCQLVPWMYLDLKTHLFSMLIDEHATQVIQVRPGESPQVVPNGTNGILHKKSLVSTGSIPWTQEGCQSRNFVPLFHSHFTKWIAAEQSGKEILTAIALAAPLVSGVPVQIRPVLHLTGGSGDGKSQTEGMLSTWFHGVNELYESTPAALHRLFPSEIFVPLDDYERLSTEIQGIVLRSVTGATKLRAGGGLHEVDALKIHSLMCITSCNPLSGEQAGDGSTVLRRVLRVTIDKNRFPVRGYSDVQWMHLQEHRTRLWNHYWAWLSDRMLPALGQKDFEQSINEIAALITVDLFKPLASFLALLWRVCEILRSDLPGFCPGTRDDVIHRWLEYLQISNKDDQEDVDGYMTALRMLFTHVTPGAVGVSSKLTVEHANGQEFFITKITNTDPHFLLRDTPQGRLPDMPPEALYGSGTRMIALEGANYAWASTLESYARNYAKGITPGAWRNWVARRTGLIDRVLKSGDRVVRMGYFWVQKCGNLGATCNQAGWRIMMVIPDESQHSVA